MRLQFGDPACELNHFEIAALIFQRHLPQPQDICEYAAEASQRDGGKGDKCGRVFNFAGKPQMILFNVLIERVLDSADAEHHHQ